MKEDGRSGAGKDRAACLLFLFCILFSELISAVLLLLLLLLLLLISAVAVAATAVAAAIDDGNFCCSCYFC